MAKKSSGTIAVPGMDEDYQAERDAHHLQEAHKIRGDKKRHKRAITHMKKHAQQLNEAAASMPPIPGTEGEADGDEGAASA